MTTSHAALDPARSAAVAASAGSGKTWLLVSRIVRLLLAGARPGGILALTFTRKAAAEMRERVALQLRHLAYASDAGVDDSLRQIGLEPGDAVRENARRQYERLAFDPMPLRAVTLHGFCQDVLARFALEAQVPAGFTLVEDESEVRAEALERFWLSIRRNGDGPLAAALKSLFDSGSRESDVLSILRGFLDLRGDWWAFTEKDADPARGAAERLALALGVTPGEPLDTMDAPAFSARLKMLAGALREVGGIGSLKSDAVYAALEVAGPARADALARALLTATGSPRVLRQKKSITDPQWIHLTESIGYACTQLAEFQERRRRMRTLQRNAAAFVLGDALLEGFRTALDRKGALGFAELEWRTCQLLGEAGGSAWVRYKLDQRLEHVLLDEFQDTNPVQWRLLRPLVDEFADRSGDAARTLFVVGDTKQSIYGFRRAAPALMAEAQSLVRGPLEGHLQPLNASWRSAPAIIGFLNKVFAGDAGRTIEFEAHETWRTEDWGAVEILPLVPVPQAAEAAAIEGLRDPLTTPFHEPAALASEEEGRLVAERLRELVSSGLPVNSARGPRPAGWGDVMVLARQRTHLWALESAFARAGIPFVGSTRGALLDTVLAQDLMALLRLLDAPHRDLDLAQVLRSPLFAASDEDLIRLARGARSASIDNTWWTSLRNTGEAEPVDAPLGRASVFLPRWLAAARALPAHDLLDRIASEGDVANRFEAALPHEPRVRANLGAFIQRVLDTDAGRYPSLGRLNRELERLARRDGDAPDEGSVATSGERVRILTVHAAKGLEAPLVFLVNAAPAAKHPGAGWRVQWPADRMEPSHFVHVGRKEERDAISQGLLAAEQERESRESLNLLYVALTRARQYLFVSGFASSKAGWDWEGSWHARCWQALEADAESRLPGSFAGSRGMARGLFPQPPATIAEPRPPPVPPSTDPRLREPLPGISRRTRRRTDAIGDVDATRRGIAIHRLLQKMAEGSSEEARLRNDLSIVLGMAVEETEFSAWITEARSVLAAEALSRFFAPGLRAWNEVPVAVAGQPLGVIDRLVDDGETVWVIDYKTGTPTAGTGWAERYSAQIGTYRDAMRRMWPHRTIRAGLVATQTLEWIEPLEP